MTEIKTIEYDTAKDFLLPRHYSGRIPSISYAYGCYNDDNLVGVLTVGKPEYLGSFKTEIEAFKAYKVAKESFIKEQANKWKDKIDERAYEALMGCGVNIND